MATAATATTTAFTLGVPVPPTLLDTLRARRAEARTAADAVLERAASEQRDLSADELATYRGHVGTERDVDDEIERRRDEELAELRAAAVRRPGPATPHEPVLTREQSVAAWCEQRGMSEPVGCVNAFMQLVGTRGAGRRAGHAGAPGLGDPRQ